MPSYSEICEFMDYQSKNAAFRLVQKMIDEGVLTKSLKGKIVPGDDFPESLDDDDAPHPAQRMAPVSPPAYAPGLKWLGTVQAGFPSPAEEELLDTVSLDEFLVRNKNASFLLRVTGDSMIDEGIRDGDLVVIERGRTPKNGDVVLAQIDGEWTLKYYEKKNNRVRLVPGNKKYPVLEPREELKIPGVLASVMRKYF